MVIAAALDGKSRGHEADVGKSTHRVTTALPALTAGRTARENIARELKRRYTTERSR